MKKIILVFFLFHMVFVSFGQNAEYKVYDYHHSKISVHVYDTSSYSHLLYEVLIEDTVDQYYLPNKELAMSYKVEVLDSLKTRCDTFCRKKHKSLTQSDVQLIMCFTKDSSLVGYLYLPMNIDYIIHQKVNTSPYMYPLGMSIKSCMLSYDFTNQYFIRCSCNRLEH